jgi:hypothetical protein
VLTEARRLTLEQNVHDIVQGVLAFHNRRD